MNQTGQDLGVGAQTFLLCNPQSSPGTSLALAFFQRFPDTVSKLAETGDHSQQEIKCSHSMAEAEIRSALRFHLGTNLMQVSKDMIIK